MIFLTWLCRIINIILLHSLMYGIISFIYARCSTIARKQLKFFIKAISAKFPGQIEKLAYSVVPNEILNYNLDLTVANQKRVLICYISLMGVDLLEANHAAYHHLNQMIHYFISKGYCVDTCYCMDENAERRLKSHCYDVIIGFGKAFKDFCSCRDIPKRIFFIMENNPMTVKIKYEERVDYFIKRHPNIDISSDQSRNEYFSEEQFLYADECITMTNSYNSNSLLPHFKHLYRINANAIINKDYLFEDDVVAGWIPSSKTNFLWFGSNGFIHKGVDIILDAFRELPDYHIDLYGISKNEKNLYERLKSDNSSDCGRVNVQSSEYIEKVISRHCFLIFPSCSEGMSTAVCTCMAHGIIPILTKESGFDPHPAIIELKSFTVEEVRKTIVMAASMSDNEVLKMRRLAYEHGRDAFSLEHFDKRFTDIMDTILRN